MTEQKVTITPEEPKAPELAPQLVKVIPKFSTDSTVAKHSNLTAHSILDSREILLEFYFMKDINNMTLLNTMVLNIETAETLGANLTHLVVGLKNNVVALRNQIAAAAIAKSEKAVEAPQAPEIQPSTTN